MMLMLYMPLHFVILDVTCDSARTKCKNQSIITLHICHHMTLKYVVSTYVCFTLQALGWPLYRQPGY